MLLVHGGASGSVSVGLAFSVVGHSLVTTRLLRGSIKRQVSVFRP